MYRLKNRFLVDLMVKTNIHSEHNWKDTTPTDPKLPLKEGYQDFE